MKLFLQKAEKQEIKRLVKSRAHSFYHLMVLQRMFPSQLSLAYL